MTSPLSLLLAHHRPTDPVERGDVDRVRRILADGVSDPWARDTPLHVTASAFVVDRSSGRVLLRWHDRQRAWIQVGGHADPGETDPIRVALREGAEETGLTDLAPWPGGPEPLHLVIVPVPAKGDEAAHEHADIRFVFGTDAPDDVTPEHVGAPLRWLDFDEALELTTEANVRESLRRTAALVGRSDPTAMARR